MAVEIVYFCFGYALLVHLTVYVGGIDRYVTMMSFRHVINLSMPTALSNVANFKYIF